MQVTTKNYFLDDKNAFKVMLYCLLVKMVLQNMQEVNGGQKRGILYHKQKKGQKGAKLDFSLNKNNIILSDKSKIKEISHQTHTILLERRLN